MLQHNLQIYLDRPLIAYEKDVVFIPSITNSALLILLIASSREFG
jgi:hypothetical protein